MGETAARRRDSDGAMLAALTSAGFAYALQQIMVVPAIPAFQRDFHTTATWSAWVYTGFLLASSVSTPILARLGDQFGRRRLLIVSLLCFLVGSLLAIGAWDIRSLIVARAVQGLGGAILPLSFAIVRDQFRPERMPRALSAISSVFGISAPVGLVLAGPIIQHLSWRYLFVIGAVGMGVAAVLVRTFVPESPVRARSKIDVPGALLLTGTLGALLIALTEGNSWGWAGPRTLGLFAASAVLALAWGYVELHSPAPMVDMRMLGRRTMLLTNLSTLFVGATSFGAFLIVPAFAQTPGQFAAEWQHLAPYGFAATATVASLYLVPGGALQILVAPLTGKLIPRIGPRIPFVTQSVLVALGAGTLAAFHSAGWQIVIGLGVMGAGVAIGLVTAPKLIGDEADVTETGVANGMNMIMRTIGGVIGSQIVAALIAARTIGSSPIPAEWGYTAAWTACSLFGVLALLVSLPLLLGRRPPSARARAARAR